MIQDTLFGRHCRFHWDFHTQYLDPNYWNSIATLYEHWLSTHTQSSLDLAAKKIPKIIHQIWLGSNLPPASFQQFANSWKIHNPKCKYFLWTDGNIGKLNLRNQSLFDSLKNYGAKSDVLRYEILQQYGGVYVDVDFECLGTIPEILFKESFVGGLQFNGSPEIGNAFLMASPDSIIINKTIEQCVMPFQEDAFEIFKATGPYLLSKVISENLLTPGAFLILPSNYVYPMPSFLASSSQKPHSFATKETFAIHYWGLSWLPVVNRRLRMRLIKILKRLFLFFKAS